MNWVITPPPRPALLVAGTDLRFPVRRIYCVGRNYAEHAREMGHDPAREAPFFFAKPPDAVVPGGGALAWPSATRELHHEVELVVALGGHGEALTPDAAASLVWGHAVGVDLTRRDLQAEAKRQARPWDTAKGFDCSAPVGSVLPVTAGRPAADAGIWLDVNGERRQQATLAALIWPVPELLAALSQLFRLAPGDLVFTGTPAGVAALAPGDRIECGVDGLPPLSLRVG